MYIPPTMPKERAELILKRWSEVRHLAIQDYMHGSLGFVTPEVKPLSLNELMSRPMEEIPSMNEPIKLLTFAIVQGDRDHTIRCEGMILETGHNF